MAALPTEDQELIRQLRTEWANTVKEGIEIRDKKGYVDETCRAKAEKLDAELNKKVDEGLAAQAKRLDEQDAKIKTFGERLSRPPGSGGDPGTTEKGLGAKVVEHDAYKNATFSGRFTIQIGLTKTRIMQRKASTITEAGAGYPILPYRWGTVPQPFPPNVMRDLVPVVPLDGTNAVEYVKEAWNLLADYQVNEGDKKAQSDVTYTDATAVVRTIAHYVKVSRQMASDVPFIMASIEQKLALGVLLKEDMEILYGNNAAGHLWGIMPQAQALAWPATPAATATAIDQLNAAETQVETNYYYPTAFVLNPKAWAALEGLKTTFGTYLLDGVPSGEGVQRLYGLPVVTTPTMAVTDFLAGAFPGNCALFDRETVNVEIAFQNEDDFIRNLITIRAEERIAFAVFAPNAFVKGTFTAPPFPLPTMAAVKDDGSASASPAATHAKHTK